MNKLYTAVRSIVLLIICLCFLSVVNSFAQNARFGYNNYIDTKGDTLRFRLLGPDYDTLRSYPLVIFLHGSGERGNDNEKQLKWGVTNFATDQMMITHPAFILAPQCPENQQWAAFAKKADSFHLSLKPSPSRQMELLINLIHQICKSNRIDTNRIYIT